MSELFKWLSTNPEAAMIISSIFALLMLSIIIVFLLAFFQGREIIFWPPKIGASSVVPKKKKIQKSDNKHTVSSHLRDISGTWETTWIFINENGEKNLTECTNYIKMIEKDHFEGEGKSEHKKWNYTLTGTIDEMGYLSGTWKSAIDSYKGSFLLKLRPSFKTIEGHVLSIAFEKDTRAGRWIWELKRH